MEVRFGYQHALNGLALQLNPREAKKITSLFGVIGIKRERLEQLSSDSTSPFMEATALSGGPHSAIG